MADKEMYDYLNTVTPDYTTTSLAVTPQKILIEEAQRNQVAHTLDDGDDVVVDLSGGSLYFIVTLVWKLISSSDAGTILDMCYDSAKANGIAKSFKWEHPTDGHIYVAKFTSLVSRSIEEPVIHAVPQIKLKVIGKVLDA